MKFVRLLPLVCSSVALIASSQVFASNTYILQGVASKAVFIENTPANGFYPGSAAYQYFQVTFTLSNGDQWEIDGDPANLDPVTQSELQSAMDAPASKIEDIVFTCPTPAVTFSYTNNGYETCDQYGNCYWEPGNGVTTHYVMFHVGTMSSPGGLPECAIGQSQLSN